MIYRRRLAQVLMACGMVLMLGSAWVDSAGASVTTSPAYTCQASLDLPNTLPPALGVNDNYFQSVTVSCAGAPDVGAIDLYVPLPGVTKWLAISLVATTQTRTAGSYATGACDTADDHWYNGDIPATFKVQVVGNGTAFTSSACTSGINLLYEHIGDSEQTDPGPNTSSAPLPVAGQGAVYVVPDGTYQAQLDTGATLKLGEVLGQYPDCAINQITGTNSSDSPNFVNGDHVYGFYLYGSASFIDISASSDPAFTQTPPANYHATFDPGTAPGSPGTLSYNFQSTGSPLADPIPGNTLLTVDVNSTYANYPWTPAALNAWCFSPASGWHNLGNLLSIASSPGASGIGAGTTAGDSSGNTTFCGSTGIGLDPASWVPAILTGGKCYAIMVLQYLFIPSSSSVNSLTQIFGISSNAPTGSVPVTEWVGAMAKIALATPASEVSNIQTVADSGQCLANSSSIPGMSLGNGHSLSVCQILTAVPSVSAAGGWISFLKGLLSVAIYGGAALLLFGFMRRVVAG